MPFSWKNDLYQESFHWSFFPPLKLLELIVCTSYSLDSMIFFLLFWGVMEMNS